MNQPKAYVFDAYGTLFDVRSVLAQCEVEFPGHGLAITGLWRIKQLEYSWLRSLMGHYQDFWELTRAGLEYTCRSLNLQLSEAAIARLMGSYLMLDTYPDAIPALERLSREGRSMAILSNGAPSMLAAVVAHAGLTDKLAHVISVDEVKIFKPHPSVYQLAPAKLGLAKEEIGFVSSNSWDAAGAKAFGFTVFWINRQNAPVEELGVVPDTIISSLLELV